MSEFVLSVQKKVSAVLKDRHPPTRGMGAMADCALARAYGWCAPIEDYSPRRRLDREPLGAQRVDLAVIRGRKF